MEPGLQGFKGYTELFRPASFVQTSIHNLTRAIILGFVLVALILFFFLFEWRVALISVVTIPLSLVAAGVLLYATRATLNTVIFAWLGIALGGLLDCGILHIENIVAPKRPDPPRCRDQTDAA